jgi:D-alanine-D-alanine ligase
VVLRFRHLPGRRIAVLSGGNSHERNVSLGSGDTIRAELEAQGYSIKRVVLDGNPLPAVRNLKVDGVVVALHGGWGEDGTIQGILELLKIPYSGSRALPSALAMNKVLAKIVFTQAGLATPPWRTFKTAQEFYSSASEIEYPVIVKPCREGSSVGVIHFDAKPPEKIIESCLASHTELFVEKFIPGLILTVGIIDVPGMRKVMRPIEIRPTASVIYDRSAKKEGLRDYVLVPALTPEQADRVCEAAWNAHAALGCSGITRTDMIFSEADGVQLLEVNTIPGMTPRGNLIAASESQGISRSQLAHYLIQSIA